MANPDPAGAMIGCGCLLTLFVTIPLGIIALLMGL